MVRLNCNLYYHTHTISIYYILYIFDKYATHECYRHNNVYFMQNHHTCISYIHIYNMYTPISDTYMRCIVVVCILHILYNNYRYTCVLWSRTHYIGTRAHFTCSHRVARIGCHIVTWPMAFSRPAHHSGLSDNR